jgi:hypothetical protein
MIERPVGFEREQRDCTVRALSLVSNIPYEKVHGAFKECGRRNSCGFKIKGRFQDVCKLLNLEAKQVKRHGFLSTFISQFPQGKYFIVKSGHAFAVIDGVVHDEHKMNSHIHGAWLITKQQEKENVITI